MRRLWFLLILLLASPAAAQNVNLNCLTGTSNPFWLPASSTNPCPVTGTVTAGQGTLASAGASQNGLAIATATALTVPANTKCAEIQIETASVRYTDDGSTAPTTTVGILIAPANTPFTYCGPVTALKFTAVSGSPTLNASYYK